MGAPNVDIQRQLVTLEHACVNGKHIYLFIYLFGLFYLETSTRYVKEKDRQKQNKTTKITLSWMRGW